MSITKDAVQVKGPKGTLNLKRHQAVEIKQGKDEGKDVLVFERKEADNKDRAAHGLMRALVNNMMTGVTNGFERKLEINGVGYKAELKGKEIHMALGFSHPVVYPLPEGVTAEYDAKANRLTVKGADKHQIGLVAAEIRKLRPPEPYKGKGVKYLEETIRRKQGKTGAA